jgi:hypothetical protein
MTPSRSSRSLKWAWVSTILKVLSPDNAPVNNCDE